MNKIAVNSTRRDLKTMTAMLNKVLRLTLRYPLSKIAERNTTPKQKIHSQPIYSIRISSKTSSQLLIPKIGISSSSNTRNPLLNQAPKKPSRKNSTNLPLPTQTNSSNWDCPTALLRNQPKIWMFRWILPKPRHQRLSRKLIFPNYR